MIRPAVIFLMLCSWASPTSAELGQYVEVFEKRYETIKPEYRTCKQDNECTVAGIGGCLDYFPVNRASKEIVDKVIRAHEAAMDCIAQKRLLPKASCVKGLCEAYVIIPGLNYA